MSHCHVNKPFNLIQFIPLSLSFILERLLERGCLRSLGNLNCQNVQLNGQLSR